MENNKCTILDEDETLVVPEEPENDEDEDESAYGADSSTERKRTISEESPKSVKSVGFSSVITAIRVAKWMAKAYGFTSRCKSSFTSQDIIHKQVISR